MPTFKKSISVFLPFFSDSTLALDRPEWQKSPWLSWRLIRYLAGEILWSFLIGTSLFLGILLTFQIIRLSDFVILHHTSLTDVAGLCGGLLLSFVPIAVPISLLFSVLMGISRLHSEGELLALQANGCSRMRIFFPIGVLGGLVSSVCLVASLTWVPKGNRYFELLITKIASEKVMSQLKAGVFLKGFYGLVLFADKILPATNHMERVFLHDERDSAHPLTILANEGQLQAVPERGVLTLRLNQGTIYPEKNDADGVQQRIDFDVYDINLALAAAQDAWRDFSPPSYDYHQLKRKLAETIHDPPLHRTLLVEMHRRFSMSFACIVFALLGFALGSLHYRGMRSTSVLLCMGVALVYWLFYIAASALSETGLFAPWIGIWAPNVVFLGLGCVLEWKNKG